MADVVAQELKELKSDLAKFSKPFESAIFAETQKGEVKKLISEIRKIRETLFCKDCGKALEKEWKMCPMCGCQENQVPPHSGCGIYFQFSKYKFCPDCGEEL